MLQINASGDPIITPEVIGKVAPLFGDQNTMLIFSAVVFGLGMRTVYRYYEEKKKGNPDAQQFDMKFLYTAIFAFVAAGMPAMALMPSATATFNAMAPMWGSVFAWAFTAGIIYSANAGINAAVSGFEKQTVNKAMSSGKLDPIIEKKVQEVLVKQSQPTTGQSPEST